MHRNHSSQKRLTLIVDRFEFIFNRRQDRIIPGLERIQRALAELGNPSLKIPCVIIGGTNGKGGTASMLFSLLSTAGLRVGLYTSPHLRNFRERFNITNEIISDEQLSEVHEKIKKDLSQKNYEALSFFELATLMAFVLFENQSLDFVVWEVGLGGKWDATNVVDPLLSVITSIGIDHSEFLGDGLLQIAQEKAGIMRTRKPILLGLSAYVNAPAEIREFFNDKAKDLDSTLICFGADMLWQKCHSRYFANDDSQHTAEYVSHNRCLAVMAYEVLQQSIALPVLSTNQLHDAIKTQSSLSCARARFETVVVEKKARRKLLLDVAHNVEGICKFGEQVRSNFPNLKLPVLVSIMADKQHAEMLDLLRGIFDPVVLFKCKNVRSFDPNVIADRHRDLFFFEDFEDCWDWALKNLPASIQPWAVCGSIYAMGEVFSYFDLQL